MAVAFLPCLYIMMCSTENLESKCPEQKFQVITGTSNSFLFHLRPPGIKVGHPNAWVSHTMHSNVTPGRFSCGWLNYFRFARIFILALVMYSSQLLLCIFVCIRRKGSTSCMFRPSSMHHKPTCMVHPTQHREGNSFFPYQMAS